MTLSLSKSARPQKVQLLLKLEKLNNFFDIATKNSRFKREFLVANEPTSIRPGRTSEASDAISNAIAMLKLAKGTK